MLESGRNTPTSTTVRRALARLRTRWEQHSPTAPFCLAEEVAPGVNAAEFCVDLLVTQRARRARARVPKPLPQSAT